MNKIVPIDAQSGSNSMDAYDIERVREDFPILKQHIYGKSLVFLDSGASAQKPQVVIDAVHECYETYYSNVHRGAHFLSQKCTDVYEQVRGQIATFINAQSENNVIFTSSVTESINLVAQTWGRKFLKKGDEIIVSEVEHHANIVPWQLLQDEIGFEIKVAKIDDQGEFLLDTFKALLSPKTKLVAITDCSNVLGTMLPVKEITRLAHEVGAKVLVDGTQGIVHIGVDVQDLDCDFYGFTGHKIYGPTGVGILYGKMDVLKSMPPYQGGGDMIDKVSFSGTTFQEPPYRFEAGTPPIAQVIGLGVAIKYVSDLGMENISAHEQGLLAYANELLSAIEGVQIIGQAKDKAAIISFLIEGTHPFDVAAVLDRQGVATRVGHHCAEPLMDRLGIVGTVRASFGLYNNKDDVDRLVAAIGRAKELLL